VHFSLAALRATDLAGCRRHSAQEVPRLMPPGAGGHTERVRLPPNVSSVHFLTEVSPLSVSGLLVRHVEGRAGAGGCSRIGLTPLVVEREEVL